MNITLVAEKIFAIGPFVITNSMLVTWLVMIFLIICAYLCRKNMTEIPGKFQNLCEMIVESILNLIEDVTIDRKKAIKFLPLVGTLFIFIILANWAGLLPGFETIGLREFKEGHEILVPFFRQPAADLNTTFALAIFSIAAVQFFGIKHLGLKYFKKFINFKSPIHFFVGFLEGISEISRIISFAFRLFGNIFAGSVLLGVISFLIPILATLPFSGLELFVGFVQALVFAMLTTVFLYMATVDHDEHAEHSEPEKKLEPVLQN